MKHIYKHLKHHTISIKMQKSVCLKTALLIKRQIDFLTDFIKLELKLEHIKTKIKHFMKTKKLPKEAKTKLVETIR